MRATLLAVILGVVMQAAAGCGQAAPASQAESSPPPPASGSYVLPPAGTTSLIQFVKAHRDATGQVLVEGRTLLPPGTRVWVEAFPATSAVGADPAGRAELYLGDGGSFEVGPFNLPGAKQFRVQVTAHFTRSWQPPEILGIVGAGGLKLPKGVLTPNDPNAPQGPAHLDYSAVVTIGAS